MIKILIARDLIICGTIIFYFLFTIRYFLVFKKNVIFTGKIKAFHLVMMWLIPFIWILILQALTKSTPGSYQIEKKEAPIPFSDNDDDAIKASQMGF